jgi:hypothetical protein
MMDTLMMTSSEMLLNRFGLYFNYIFSWNEVKSQDKTPHASY